MNSWRNIFATWRAQIQPLLPTVAAERMPEGELSSREQIIHQLVALQEQDRVEVVARERQITEISESLRRLEVRMNALHDQLRTVWAQKLAHSLQIGVAMDKLRAQLAETAPPGLERLLERVDEAIDGCRRTPVMNAQISARLDQLGRIREQALALKIAPLSTADALTRLRELEHTHGSITAA